MVAPSVLDPPDEPASPQELSDMAMTAAARALRAGKPSEASAYLRVVEALGRIAAPERAQADEPPQMSEEELAARTLELQERAVQIQALLAAGAHRGQPFVPGEEDQELPHRPSRPSASQATSPTCVGEDAT